MSSTQLYWSKCNLHFAKDNISRSDLRIHKSKCNMNFLGYVFTSVATAVASLYLVSPFLHQLPGMLYVYCKFSQLLYEVNFKNIRTVHGRWLQWVPRGLAGLSSRLTEANVETNGVNDHGDTGTFVGFITRAELLIILLRYWEGGKEVRYTSQAMLLWMINFAEGTRDHATSMDYIHYNIFLMASFWLDSLYNIRY